MGSRHHQGLPPLALIDPLIDAALAEDLGSGDITSACCVAAGRQARSSAIARGRIVVCGGAVFARTFQRVDPSVQLRLVVAEGDAVDSGACIWQVHGDARALLSAERVALNLAQRLSGTATLTRSFVDALAPGTSTRIVGTRKTTPGLRALQRYAVRVGGGHNHRDNLASAVMIKDNHIAAVGGIGAAVDRARRWAPHTCRVEVEVTTMAQLDEALRASADVVMLDNMTDEQIAQAMALIGDGPAGSRPVVEVSGGVTRDRVAELSAAGVDVISVGALTHSAPAADISLELELEPRQP